MRALQQRKQERYSRFDDIKCYYWWIVPALLASAFTLLPFYSSIPLFYKIVRSFPLSAGIAKLYSSPQTIPAASGFVLYWTIASLSTFVLVGGWLWLFQPARLKALPRPNHQALIKYIRGVSLGLGMFSAIILILLASGVTTFKMSLLTQVSSENVVGVLLVYLGWMLQGPKEEVVYRGWLLTVLEKRYAAWLSILLSSLTFALAHLLNPHFSLLAALNLTLFGVFCGIYSRVDKSMWGVAGMHTAWNWSQGQLFGLPVSGIRYPGGILLPLYNTSATWLNGGDFGPEGGLAATLILIIGILCVCLVRYIYTPPDIVAIRPTQPLTNELKPLTASRRKSGIEWGRGGNMALFTKRFKHWYTYLQYHQRLAPGALSERSSRP